MNHTDDFAKQRLLRYADGKPRPLLRGVLHGMLSSILLVAFAAVAMAIVAGFLPNRWWGLVGWFAGKAASYCASAWLHLVDFKCVSSATNALRIDLVAVTCHFLHSFSSTIFDLFLEGVDKHLGHDHPTDGVWIDRMGASSYRWFLYDRREHDCGLAPIQGPHRS
jgi:hypothetical protein